MKKRGERGAKGARESRKSEEGKRNGARGNENAVACLRSFQMDHFYPSQRERQGEAAGERSRAQD